MNRFENPEFNPEKEKEISETEIYPIINTQLQQRYDRIATNWESEAYKGTRRDDLIPRLLEISEIKNGQQILEAMCGTAILSREIKNLFPQCENYALDFSQGMLNMAPKELNKIQASVVAMPFSNESFDKIFLRSAIYDLPKRMQLKALQEINRVLTSDGTFILQTYFTDETTFSALNNIVNIKDLASGQYQDMGQEEYPRYFAKLNELTQWFKNAGFNFEQLEEFEGIITYLRTNEMTNMGKSLWTEYIERLPQNIKDAIKLRVENDGTISYNFPGVIYKLKKY